MKLVLMSATLSVDTFIDFFADLRSSTALETSPDPDPRSCVKIEGRMFPVKECYLEDALEWTGHELPNSDKAQRNAMEKVALRLEESSGKQCSERTLRSLAVAGERDVHQELLRELVLLFHRTAEKFKDKCKSGILVFLPGWADISGLYQRLQGERGLWPLMLHAGLSAEDQQRVFEHAPKGKRKVVLSTNIAETSVTIEDIVFVINSGVMKERVFDADRQLGALETTLNTWANATQRAGRAGRTREGVVVHLFPQWKLPELRRWPTPEILSKSLEEVVLQLLALGLGDPHDVLSRSLSQPSIACVEHAVWLLQEMSMMSQQEALMPSEALLPLGRWLAPIPLHPMSSKALLYGALFGVLLPVAAAVAFLNIKSPFVQPANGQMLRGGKDVLVRGKHSDHYAMAAAYFGWRARCSYGDGDAFIDEHGLSRETLDMGDQLVRSLLRMMVDEYEYDGDDAAFADDADSGSWTTEAIFEDPQTWTFCKAAMCAAFVPQFVRSKGTGQFESDSNEEVVGHASSCNQGYRPVVNPYAPPGGKASDDWLVYTDSMKLGKVSIMESTVVGAPYVVLFSRSLSPVTGASACGQVDFDGWRGSLAGGEAALNNLQRARGDLQRHLTGILESQTASMLGKNVMDRLAHVLSDRGLALRGVTGTREQRIGVKEAATIWVGSLPDEADEEDLRQLFGTFGQVDEVNLVNDRETGRRRGFGFVTMGSREEAELASQRLQGTHLRGRRLRLELKGTPAKGKGKGVAAPLQRRRWIKPPTEQQRLAVVEAMRLRTVENRIRATGRKKVVSTSLVRHKVTQESGCTGFQDELKVKVEVKVEVEEQSSRKEPQMSELPMAASNTIPTWSELLLRLAQVRLGKKEAAKKEEFAEASRLKRQEAELNVQIEKAQSEASCQGSGAEIARLQEAKRRAVAEEDFAEASRLKKRLRALEDSGTTQEDTVQEAWNGAILLARASEGGPELMQELMAAAPAHASAASRADVAAAPESRSAALQAGERQTDGQPPRAGGTAAEVPELKDSFRREDRAAGSSGATGALMRAGKREEREGAAGVAEEPYKKRRTDVSEESQPQTKLLQVKEEVRTPQVKKEHESLVPGRTLDELLAMSNQDLWQHAWNITWQKADALGQANDEAIVYAQAQKTWKEWLAERDRLSKEQAAVEGRQKAEEIHKQAQQERLGSVAKEEVAVKEQLGLKQESSSSTDNMLIGRLSQDQLAAQEAAWSESKGAQADWQKVTSEVEKRRKAKEETPKTGRDLCALVKQRCPADQPLQFERLLAVCPKDTSVRQLVAAMSKEPQEFRQNWDGSEYCVRPVNSRCVDWLPVQATTTPPGFREDASLPEEMLVAAKAIFEERLKPSGQAAEDALAQFLTAPNRLPPDTPLPFAEILKHCPPGTQPADVVKTMSKRRDSFRQDPTGRLFCVKPRGRCGKWAAVNPYLNPLSPAPSASPAPAAAAGSKVEPSDNDGGEY